jgi:hypothetical protein
MFEKLSDRGSEARAWPRVAEAAAKLAEVVNEYGLV